MKEGDTKLQLCIDRLRAGDESARDLVIEHAYERLRRFVATIRREFPCLDRWVDLDDVLQESSRRVWQALEKVEINDVDHFFAIAGRHIRWAIGDLLRRYYGPGGLVAKYSTSGGRGGQDSGRSIEKGDPTHGSLTLSEYSEFHEQVERLSEEQRRLFDLLYYNGMSQKEAANHLGIPPSMLKRQWRQAQRAVARAVKSGRAESP
jgi:RNA polymerase sigma factor (sigma-70 family)